MAITSWTLLLFGHRNPINCFIHPSAYTETNWNYHSTSKLIIWLFQFPWFFFLMLASRTNRFLLVCFSLKAPAFISIDIFIKSDFFPPHALNTNTENKPQTAATFHSLFHFYFNFLFILHKLAYILHIHSVHRGWRHERQFDYWLFLGWAKAIQGKKSQEKIQNCFKLVSAFKSTLCPVKSSFFCLF